MRLSLSFIPIALLVIAGSFGITGAVAAQSRRDSSLSASEGVDDVVIHPVVRPHFVCLEHPAGQLPSLGDALGSDCLVPDLTAGPAHRWPSFYRGDGQKNQDWYGWGVTVLAPFDGVVDSVYINPLTNQPGQRGSERASVIVFHRPDGVRVLYAHVQRIEVHVGERVTAGQSVAQVGNNGAAWFPHIHIGAWKGDQPLQVRFDLRAMGRMRRSN